VSEPLRVLFAASECAPLTKTGGLADVACSLPSALRALGVDARVLLPGYRDVLASAVHPRRAVQLPRLGNFPAADLIEAQTPGGEPLLMLACPELFERDGGPYVDSAGQDWPDNALRFGYFSYVAAALCGPSSPHPWRCDIMHCNDWQTGLAPAYLHWSRQPGTPSLMTIHNLAYQGVFPPSLVPQLGLPPESFDINGVEYYGNMSFLKAGVYYASRVNTVSPTYAREIQSEPLGFGMHGLLTSRGAALEGILNGVDTTAWDAATDRALSATYDAQSLARKARNTSTLRQRFGLNPSSAVPLIGIVSRLISQKGIDLVVAAAERIVAMPAQLLVLGTGDTAIERELSALAERHRGTIAFMRGFDEALSHLIEAGADIFLMPSRFEPCGLNQMYSQRYGTPPIVRRTGGLADSVVDCTAETLAAGTGSGFVFDEPTSDALLAAIARAVHAWHTPSLWRKIQRAGMAKDFSWNASARRYLGLYQSMLVPGA
jgi:starch synthase